MRYTPFAAAAALFVAVSASTSFGQAETGLDARVTALIDSGRAALVAGELDTATDRFEAALAIAPGYAPTYLDLAQVATAKGLYGQAIHYYREAQERDPGNLAAISGEGSALVAKGAEKQAERNLARLQSLCGTDCRETAALNAAIARGPVPQVKSADASASDAIPGPATRN